VAEPTPYGRYGVAEATPKPLGVVRPPPKAKTHSFFLSFLAFGGGLTTPKGLGVASATLYQPVWGGQSHPQALEGDSATPKSPNLAFFLFFWPFRVAKPPPRAEATPYRPYWPKIGWSDHPIFGQGGGWSHPSPSFFFFFFFLHFPFG
jgi:hypothetical protein